MLRFFTNRELSRNLLIPLSKWKRWSREFLPPDPLGGLQSGVARRYSVDQALTVFIGGHLVAELKISIPEARQIMGDLRSCFNDIGAFAGTRIHHRYQLGEYGTISSFCIFLCRNSHASSGTSPYHYTVRGLTSRNMINVGPHQLHREEYFEVCVPISTQSPLDIYKTKVKILPISALVDQFTSALDLDCRHFPILDRYNPDS